MGFCVRVHTPGTLSNKQTKWNRIKIRMKSFGTKAEIHTETWRGPFGSVWNGMAWNESDEPNLNIVTNNSCRICYVNVNLRRFIHSLYHFLVPNWRTPFSDTFLSFFLPFASSSRFPRSVNAFLERIQKRRREVKSHFFSLFVSRAKPKNLSFNLRTDNGRIIEYAEYFRIAAIRWHSCVSAIVQNGFFHANPIACVLVCVRVCVWQFK